jgi:hypothetical protein
VIADGFTFDLWSLRDTWAFRQGLVQHPTFSNLPRTRSLNIESVAVELSGERAVFESGFAAAVSNRVIELNLEPLPSASQVITRARALSARLGFDLGSRLRTLIQLQAERCPRMLVPGGGRAWPNKKLVELGAVRDLMDALRDAGVRDIQEVHPRAETKPQTPPDVLGRGERGELIGFEVVELTDQNLIEHNIPRSRKRYQAMRAARAALARRDALVAHPEQVRIWSAEELLREVKQLVKEKDGKAFVIDDEPYSERWLVIHTSEPFVDWQAFVDQVARTRFGPLQQLDEVYVVRDFDPATGGYPWCRAASGRPGAGCEVRP